MENAYLNEIKTYYRDCVRDYEIVLQLKEAMALHYGYWDKDTLTHRQALWNMNYQLARHAQIASSDHVLDAGCGIGGTSFFLAENIGCKVHGISITPEQVDRANAYREKNNLETRTEFSLRDYTNTGFPDNTFDVVIGIESVCYAEPKTDFLKEAFRVLKPGGRVIIADFFVRDTLNDQELDLVRKWEETWAIQNFIREEAFSRQALESGFARRLSRDISENTYPSIKLLHRSYYPGIAITRLGYIAGKKTKAQVLNSKCGYFQYRTFRDSLWRYKYFLAIKPPVDEGITTFDDYLRTELPIEPYIDSEPMRRRFPILRKQGISLRNVAKRLMHFYLETGIRKAERRF